MYSEIGVSLKLSSVDLTEVSFALQSLEHRQDAVTKSIQNGKIIMCTTCQACIYKVKSRFDLVDSEIWYYMRILC